MQYRLVLSLSCFDYSLSLITLICLNMISLLRSTGIHLYCPVFLYVGGRILSVIVLLALTGVASAQTIQLNVGKLISSLVKYCKILTILLGVYSHALQLIVGWGLVFCMRVYGTTDFYSHPA